MIVKTKQDLQAERHKVVDGKPLKLCIKCTEWKDPKLFGKNKTKLDGLQVWCKECMRARHRPGRKQKRKKKKTAKRPAVERPQVETTPHPRAGDNEAFKEFIDPDRESVLEQAEADKSKETGKVILGIEDVAEWVKWPFDLWSTSQGLAPIIKEKEALEIAEPLTRILNRHGVGEQVPPDVLDIMQLIGRAVPVVKRGTDMVKQERKRRAAGGEGKAARKGPPTPQGAPVTEPIEA